MKGMRDMVDYVIGTSLGIIFVVFVVKKWFAPDCTVLEILRFILRSRLWWWV